MKKPKPQGGYCEFNKTTNYNPNEKPAKVLKGWNDGHPVYETKQIGDSRTVYVYKFQHKQAKRKGLRNLKALKSFLKDK